MALPFGLGSLSGLPGADNTSYSIDVTNQIPNTDDIEISTYSVVPDIGGMGGFIGSSTGGSDIAPYAATTEYRNPSVCVKSMFLDLFPGGAEAIAAAYCNWCITATITEEVHTATSNGDGSSTWHTESSTVNPKMAVGVLGVNVGSNGSYSYTLITTQNIYTSSYPVNHVYNSTELVKAILNNRNFDGYILFPQIEGFTMSYGFDASKDWLLAMYKNTCKKELSRDQSGSIVGTMRFKHCTFSPITGTGGVLQIDASKLYLPSDCRYNVNTIPAGFR